MQIQEQEAIGWHLHLSVYTTESSIIIIIIIIIKRRNSRPVNYSDSRHIFCPQSHPTLWVALKLVF